MTALEHACVAFVEAFNGIEGHRPSITRIAGGLQINRETAGDLLHRLREQAVTSHHQEALPRL